MKNSQVALICAAILGAALINAVSNVVMIRSLKSDKLVRRPRADGRDSAPGPHACLCCPDHRGPDAQEQGQLLLHRLPQRGRGSRQGAGSQAHLGRADRSRPGQAKRGGRYLDHPWRRRDRGRRREPRRDLVRSQESPRPRHQGAHLGRRRRPARAISSSTRPPPKGSARRSWTTRPAS